MPRVSTLALNIAPAAVACVGFVAGVYMRDEAEVSTFAVALVIVTLVSGLFASCTAGIIV